MNIAKKSLNYWIFWIFQDAVLVYRSCVIAALLSEGPRVRIRGFAASPASRPMPFQLKRCRNAPGTPKTALWAVFHIVRYDSVSG